MVKTNRFRVKKIKENVITVEEGRKDRSPFVLFFIKNGRLIFLISLLFSITLFIISIYFAISNIGDSSVVEYESNGLIVSFSETDNSILNGTPITDEYAAKVFDNYVNNSSSCVGVVIKMKQVDLLDRTIVYYSDNTALVKYNNGSYLKIYSVNGKFGISDDGIIDKNAITKNLTGSTKLNSELDLSVIYLSDGSVEVTKGNTTFYVRNSDITNTSELFYSNMSGVSLPLKLVDNQLHYSDGTIRGNDYIIVENIKYGIVNEKDIYGNIKIIYYDNGYAEVIRDDLSVMVKYNDHIIYSNNSFEIIDNSINDINIKDIMDIKEINLNNTNTEDAHYIIVLEETDNYKKYDISNILSKDFIRFNISVNGNKIENNILNNNLKENKLFDGLSLNNNTYLLYEGNIDKLSVGSIKIGLWIDYEDITNEYMNSAFVGTLKVYVESLE